MFLDLLLGSGVISGLDRERPGSDYDLHSRFPFIYLFQYGGTCLGLGCSILVLLNSYQLLLVLIVLNFTFPLFMYF